MRRNSSQGTARPPRAAAREVVSRARGLLDNVTAALVQHRGDRQYRTFFGLGARDGLRHRPRPYDGAVLLFRSEERLDEDLHGYWEQFLPGPHRWVEASGDHRTMLAEPHVGPLADEVRRTVDGLVAPTRR